MTRALWLLGFVLCFDNVSAQEWRVERIVGLQYPDLALVKGLQGSVELHCYIRNDGKVVRAEPARGEPELVSAAIRNAMRWRFTRISSGRDDPYTLVYHFNIQRVQVLTDAPTFRFIAPNQVFVTAERMVPGA
jgi:TonB family protein